MNKYLHKVFVAIFTVNAQNNHTTLAMQWKNAIAASLVDRLDVVVISIGHPDLWTPAPYILICGGTWKMWCAIKSAGTRGALLRYTSEAATRATDSPNQAVRAIRSLRRSDRLSTESENGHCV